MRDFHVITGKLIYKLSEARYTDLMVSIQNGAGFSFESDELVSRVDLDLNTRDIGEEAAFFIRHMKALTDDPVR